MATTRRKIDSLRRVEESHVIHRNAARIGFLQPSNTVQHGSLAGSRGAKQNRETTGYRESDIELKWSPTVTRSREPLLHVNTYLVCGNRRFRAVHCHPHKTHLPLRRNP